MEKPTFLIPSTKKAFNLLRQAFIKALILRHFDPKCHIQIETDPSSYAISEVLSQLTPDQLTYDHLIFGQDKLNSTKSKNLAKFDFGQLHPVTYFFRKMIPAKTRYKIHNAKLLAIIKAFKTCRH